MKLAIYKRLGEHFNYETVGMPENYDNDPAYARMSEYVYVEFPRLPLEQAVQNQLTQLDFAEREIRAKFDEALNEIMTQRKSLLALPHLQQQTEDAA